MSKEKSILGGAVLAAFVGSLCCTLPLLFILLGVSAGVTSTYFEALRPYLLAISVSLLALAFYWTYMRRGAAADATASDCAPGEKCAGEERFRGIHIALWISTLAVIAFALMPFVAAPLGAKLIERQTAAADCCVAQLPAIGAVTSGELPNQLETVTFVVEGMTCEACEAGIKLALEHTEGVESAKVSYGGKMAVVKYDRRKTSPERLRERITATGYSATERK